MPNNKLLKQKLPKWHTSAVRAFALAVGAVTGACLLEWPLGAAVGMAVAFSVMESDLKPGVQGRLGAPSSSSQPNAAERGILELSKDLTIVRDQLFPDPVPTP